MEVSDLKKQLQQMEQFGLGLNLSLKHSSAQARAAMSRGGFDKNKRIVIQRFSYLLVKACRASLEVLK